jgi:hypothetical protein
MQSSHQLIKIKQWRNAISQEVSTMGMIAHDYMVGHVYVVVVVGTQ